MSEDVCAICHEPFSLGKFERVTLGCCVYAFHQTCLEENQRFTPNNKRCPGCTQPLLFTTTTKVPESDSDSDSDWDWDPAPVVLPAPVPAPVPAPFDFGLIPPYGAIGVIGSANSGKTSFLRDYLDHHTTADQLIWVDPLNSSPGLPVDYYPEFTEAIATQVKASPAQHKVIIIDNPRMPLSQATAQLIRNSRHYRASVAISMRTSSDLKPCIRVNLDWVCLLGYPTQVQCRQIWATYGQLMASSTFDSFYTQYTADHGCLLLNCNTRQWYWYRVKEFATLC
jgi:hypothetical protein